MENPGLLPIGLTVEDITSGISKVRNRVIARVFQELHLIEKWGSGVQRMISSCVNMLACLPQNLKRLVLILG
ncbi:ATP-binding protein [Candidatus Jidaibacter acanthamoebae]|uniref:ATP-binding protein n=1 Tax=Candidatus Jidaibacter acanthamoebae TaxID=86105 RepID=UPI003977CA7C